MAMNDLGFMQGFRRLCADGWGQGWHESNGGNLSYRMTDADVAAAAPLLTSPREWVELGVACPDLGGQHLVCTGAGKHLRNVALNAEENLGIVELSPQGDAYRVVWGLTGGARPTSELPSHVMSHGVCARRTQGESRVIYHAHAPGVIEMTSLAPLTSREFSRALWKTMTECVIVIPQGVGVVEWMVPGSAELAQATARLMERFDAVVWAHHGLFACGPDFDAAFGLMHTVEKAAQVYVATRAANGGSDAFLNEMSDQALKDTCRRFGISPNQDFID